MKAMILAAGEGRRLRPLTYVCPKVLAPVANIPTLGRVIESLKTSGVRDIIINAHHHYKKIVDFAGTFNQKGMRVAIKIETEILGTGGGIKNTEDFWNEEPFIVVNGDTLTDIDIKKVYQYHRERNNLVTMVLQDLPRHNKIRLDGGMNILSINKGSNLTGCLAFTGIHVIDPEILDYIPRNKKYNILDCYSLLINQKRPIRGYIATEHKWIDIGTIDDYREANFSFLPPGSMVMAQHCHVDPYATMKDWVVMGKECVVKGGAIIQRSVLWDNVIVEAGVKVVDSVVTSNIIVEGDLFRTVAIKK